MKENVMIYEVKSKAAPNAKELFSNNLKYFYWNETKFKNLIIGDYVFVVNRISGWVLFAQLDKISILTKEKANTTIFNDLGKEFIVSGKWNSFIRLEILKNIEIPKDWQWKSLGNSETTYLNGARIGLDSSNNRIKNIDQLENLAVDNNITQILENCRTNFMESSTKPKTNEKDKKNLQKIEMKLIPAFIQYLKSQNLFYDDRLVKRFVCSLATKPFVILTGNSGSGKSKIALEFSKWMSLGEMDTTSEDLYKGKILPDNSGFIWRVESSNVKWEKIDFSKAIGKLFFNLFDFKSPEDMLIVTDDGQQFKARYTIYQECPAIYAYRDFSKWLQSINIGNYYKIEPQIQKDSSYKLCLKFSKLSNEDKLSLRKENENRYTLVPVGADWTDNRSVLGYFNPLSTPSSYISTPILELILEAEKKENMGFPYFLILDEMNLSHVERYFSDFLSLMESSDQPIKLHSSNEELKVTGNETLIIPKQIEKLPKNLFVIGTVNIDETTYMFSPKVLDRANVIEIKTTKDSLKKYAEIKKSIPVFASNAHILEFMNSSKYSLNSDLVNWIHPLTLKERENIKTEILNYFECLEKHYLEFGFRTLDEAIRYTQVVREMTADTDLSLKEELLKTTSIDEQVIQKFITKLNGSKSKMDALLKELFILSNDNKTEWSKDIKIESNKLTANKLNQMIIRVNQDQFVSFI